METRKPGVNSSTDEKAHAMSLPIAQLEHPFGRGAMMRLGVQPAAFKTAMRSTGAMSLEREAGPV